MVSYTLDKFVFQDGQKFALDHKVTKIIDHLNYQFVDLNNNKPKRMVCKPKYDPNFKTTVIPKRNDFEKVIAELRGLINKMTDKTFDKILENVLELIEKMDNTDENFDELSKIIFNIASTNKYFSNIYADFYEILLDKYEIFMVKLTQCLETNHNLICNFKYVSPDDNYGDFCKMNDENERRRALVSFFSNLCTKGIIDITTISKYVDDMLKTTKIELVKEDNAKIVEEIAEILFILVTLNYDKMKCSDGWSDTMSRITVLSTLKPKDYTSCSSRSRFKYLDILDFVSKKEK